MATGAVIARIVSQYSDKGSKAAVKDITRLGKQFDAFGKKALKSFGLAATGAAALAVKIGKDSVQAAIEQQKSQTLLANTLKNSIGATDAQIAAIENYIDKTELLTNVQDTELRDSFTKLAVALGNISDATDVQGVALDVAAGTGKDLASVTDALTKASQGNFTALKKLVPTLDANIVKNKDLGAALLYLNTTYKDAAETAAKKDPWTRLTIVFENLQKKIGTLLLPAFIQFATYIETSIVPAVESWITANGYRLTDSLILVVDNIKEVVKAFTNIYNVIKGINNVLPMGIAGWIQLGVALALAGKIAMLYNAFQAALGVTLLATNAALRAAAAAALEKSAADGVAALGGQKLALVIATTAVNLKTYIVDAYAARVASLQAAAGFTAAGTAATGFNTALIRLKATFLTALGFLKRYAKQLAIALAAFEAINWLLDKINGKDKVTLSEDARKVEYSMFVASLKGYETMDSALAKYNKSKEETIGKTKEQIAEEKRLAAIKAKQAAADKARAKWEADYAKLNKTLADRAGVKLLSSEDEKMVQINAAIALADRQKTINLLDKERLQNLKDEVLLQKVRLDLAQRYNDILIALADNQISDKDIATLAAKWGVTVEAAKAYISTLFAVQDAVITDDEIINLAKQWGSTQQQAAFYLDFYQAINDGILSTAEIDKLKTKWELTEDQVRMYADFVGIVNDGKLDDTEIKKIQDKWKLTTDQVVAYLLKIGAPVTYSGTLIEPGRLAELAWKDAKTALEAYLALLAKGTGVVVKPGTTPSTPSTSAADKAAQDAADAAAKAAADAAKVLAESEAAMKDAIAKRSAEIKAASGRTYLTDREMDSILTAVGSPYAPSTATTNDDRESGIIEALRQARIDASAGVPSNFDVGSFRMAEAASMAGLGSVSRGEYDERFRFQSSTMNTAAGINSGNLMAGGSVSVTVNVAGSVTAEEDLVQAVRNGLLATQYNGNQINLQAV